MQISQTKKSGFEEIIISTNSRAQKMFGEASELSEQSLQDAKLSLFLECEKY